MNNKDISRKVIMEELEENAEKMCLSYILRKYFKDGLTIKIDDIVEEFEKTFADDNELSSLNVDVTDEEIKFYFKKQDDNIIKYKFVNELLDELIDYLK